ncbi:hypothetical protein [Microvirga tunisiensis]|uniref:hypothetical protein n=1 Tax=Microvirga tunisiensis TaxID=2108360 RepID=UPI00128B3CBB|nr:hypothetical protein [Microvirga tunisiensis]MPR13175.1 hypothetical protein [Microvirga tunisiensis]
MTMLLTLDDHSGRSVGGVETDDFDMSRQTRLKLQSVIERDPALSGSLLPPLPGALLATSKRHPLIQTIRSCWKLHGMLAASNRDRFRGTQVRGDEFIVRISLCKVRAELSSTIVLSDCSPDQGATDGAPATVPLHVTERSYSKPLIVFFALDLNLRLLLRFKLFSRFRVIEAVSVLVASLTEPLLEIPFPFLESFDWTWTLSLNSTHFRMPRNQFFGLLTRLLAQLS